jgi:hypothetical protein
MRDTLRAPERHETILKHVDAEISGFLRRVRISQPNISVHVSQICEPVAASSRLTLRLVISRRLQMRILSMIAVAGAMIASTAGAFASELPSYEVKSFPISAAQVQLLGAADVQEQTVAPTLTVAGMPASPAQIAVLSRRAKLVASNATSDQR